MGFDTLQISSEKPKRETKEKPKEKPKEKLEEKPRHEHKNKTSRNQREASFAAQALPFGHLGQSAAPSGGH